MSRDQYDAKMIKVYEQWSRCGVDNENLLIMQGLTKDEYIASLEAELEKLLKAQEEK